MTMIPRSRYHYESGIAAEEIRIFHLYPGSDLDTTLEGHLRIASLASEPLYEALSYTWDGAFDDEVLPSDEILLAGLSLQITGNLGHALRRLRGTTKRRRIWIDAICINQSDVPERNAQVSQMASIYRGAQTVIVWLGEESELGDAAFLGSLCKYWTELNRDQRPHPSIHGKMSAYLKKVLDENTRVSRHSWPTILACFCQRRYFKRRWVIQEILTAAVTVVMCGAAIMDLPSLRVVLGQIQSYIFFSAEDESAAEYTSFRRTNEWMQDIGALAIGEDRCILEMLRKCRTLQCKDERDLVYSLAGCSDPEFVIDYRESVNDIFTRLASTLLRAGSGSFGGHHVPMIAATLLCSADQASMRPQNATLPSWVPDWRIWLNNPDTTASTSAWRDDIGLELKVKKIYSSGEAEFDVPILGQVRTSHQPGGVVCVHAQDRCMPLDSDHQVLRLSDSDVLCVASTMASTQSIFILRGEYQGIVLRGRIVGYYKWNDESFLFRHKSDFQRQTIRIY